MFPNVFSTLKKLHGEGFKLVIITNEVGHTIPHHTIQYYFVLFQSTERFKSADALNKAFKKKIGRLTGFCNQLATPIQVI